MIRTEYKPEDFYSTYEKHREYVFPNIGKKHIRDFRINFWINCDFHSNMSVLEIGCGTGLFLKFLETQGISDFYGIDADEKVLGFMPETLKRKVSIIDVDKYLDKCVNILVELHIIEQKVKFNKILTASQKEDVYNSIKYT